MTRICFIDDDADNRRQWREWAENRGLSVKTCESAFEANKVTADVFVFDVSAASDMFGRHAYSPILRLMEDHPSAKIVVGSCMSRRYVEEVLDEIEQIAGQRPFFFDASDGFAGLEKILPQIV